MADKAPGKPKTTLDMVIEAIQKTGDRKGTSVQAIKSYILTQYPNVNPNMLKTRLRKALEKGFNLGFLVRPKKTEAQGKYFRWLVILY